jgi:hypothetical protein
VPCTVQHWNQFKGAAALVVQERSKDAGTVKPRPTQKVDGSVQANQGGSLKIADNAVIFDRLSHASVVGEIATINKNCTRLLRPLRFPFHPVVHGIKMGVQSDLAAAV